MKALTRIFEEHEIRAVVIKGEPWFVAVDVCTALGLEQVTRSMDRLDPDERGLVKVTHPQSPEKTIEVNAVNESGLYSLIIRSSKPEAKRFRKWITSEVLPSIRKTGRYALTRAERTESAAARNAVTRQWFEHGADKPYHFINLTRGEYKALFGTSKKKKADMTAMELAALSAFEGVEAFKLMQNRGIQGYQALSESIEETGRTLPLYIAGKLISA